MDRCCRWFGVAVGALLLVVGGLVGSAEVGQAQEVVLANRGPRFLVAETPTSTRVPIDARSAPVLRRRIALDLDGVTLADALTTLGEKTGLEFVYSRDVIAPDSRVHLQARQITIAAALTELLLDSGVDVLLSPGTQIVLVKRDTAAVRMTGTIVGRVADANTGEDVNGADVLLEGTQWRASSGADGRFRLGDVVPGTYTFVVRRIGYARHSRPITVLEGEEVTVDVALEPQPTQLDEVVTTVTGEQRLRELGHVVGRINADSLVKEAPVSSLSELLNGRVSGVQVFQSQGTVGGEVKVQIRGMNSLELSNEPIVIIDGVRYTTDLAGAMMSTTGGKKSGPFNAEVTSRLNDLNPNDIESIEVVKGPSAATLYGTDAANGVLVITTKRGRPGPARWNVYAKGTQTEIPGIEFPDLYWGWGTVFGVPDNATASCTLDRLGTGGCTQQDSVVVLPNPLNDQALTIFGNKPRWQYGMNVAGGRQDLRYYFSGDFEDATGPVQMPTALAEQLMEQRGLDELPEEWQNPNAFTKLNLRANISAVLGETADLRLNTGYVRSSTRSLGDKSPYSTGVFTGGPNTPYGSFAENPAQQFVRTATERTDRFVASANGQWRPASWLTTRATMGLDLTGANRYSLLRRGDAPSDWDYPNGAVGDERVRQVSTTAEVGATAALRWGRVSSRTAVGAQYVRNLADALQSTGRDLPPGGTSVGEAASVQSRQTYSETITLGSYIEETFGLNDRLFLTGALRVDGASTFGQDYDAAAYPKLSASWIVSEEPFIPRVPGLDELRLRYAYGASGRQPTSQMALPFFFPTQAVENGSASPVVGVNSFGNRDLRPERVREHEFGLDAAALGSRLQMDLTWYRRRTADQIVGMNMPTGLGFRFTNLGLTTQHGFEATLRAQVLTGRFLSWDVTLQHGLHRTKVVDIGEASDASRFGGYVEGYPLGGRFKAPLAGYADANGDGVITFSEIEFGESPVYLGESVPPETQTLTTVVGLFERRLRLSALIERRSGFTQVNVLGWRQCVEGVCEAMVDRSTPLAVQAQIMGDMITGGTVEPADFTRLREVTAAVDVPAGLTRALRVRSATLALSVRNLALWTDFSGPDPESVGVGGFSPVSGGFAAGLPQGRSWTLRLDLGL